jgi:hypothetical protein
MKDQIIAAPWEPASTVMSEKSFAPRRRSPCRLHRHDQSWTRETLSCRLTVLLIPRLFDPDFDLFRAYTNFCSLPPDYSICTRVRNEDSPPRGCQRLGQPQERTGARLSGADGQRRLVVSHQSGSAQAISYQIADEVDQPGRSSFTASEDPRFE